MEKSPFIKKSPEIKSYQSETLFLAPVWFFTKKSSDIKSCNKWKCMIHNSRFLFSSDSFSSGLFFLVSYFLRLYWQPPCTYCFRKKSPRNPKHRTLFQWHFFRGLDKIRTVFPKFLFPGCFFPETFFPGTYLHRFKK